MYPLSSILKSLNQNTNQSSQLMMISGRGSGKAQARLSPPPAVHYSYFSSAPGSKKWDADSCLTPDLLLGLPDPQLAARIRAGTKKAHHVSIDKSYDRTLPRVKRYLANRDD